MGWIREDTISDIRDKRPYSVYSTGGKESDYYNGHALDAIDAELGGLPVAYFIFNEGRGRTSCFVYTGNGIKQSDVEYFNRFPRTEWRGKLRPPF